MTVRARKSVYSAIALAVLALSVARPLMELVSRLQNGVSATAQTSPDYLRLSTSERAEIAERAERTRRAHHKPPRHLLPEDQGQLPAWPPPSAAVPEPAPTYYPYR